MSVATAPKRPLTFVALPVASWAFAVRIWLAVVVSLYASFWLQLEAPGSSAITAAILALPTRGQALEKAGFRLAATVIGVAASIAIVGLFSQARDLLLLAFAAWLGLCIYATGLSDGNRAYAAILSGYTVALIAIQHTDTPQQVFESGVARGAAIVVGIVAIAVVNDLLVAPDHHPGIVGQLAALHRRVRDQAKAVARGEAIDAPAMAAVLREIAALRSDLTSLVTEGVGRAGSAAARSAVVTLVAELHAARALSVLPLAAAPFLRDRLTSALDGDGVDDPSAASLAVHRRDERGEGSVGAQALADASLAWAVAEVLRRDRDVGEALAALASGRRPAHAWRAPLYRSHRIAAAMGLRAAVWLAVAAGFFVVAGWPDTEGSLSLVAVMIGLGAITPDPRAFTTIALIAIPISALLAGILEFLILHGATAFPLLAIGLAPFVIGPTLLMTLPSPLLASLGRLSLIFILAILGPSNPPSYNPQTFLFLSLFVVLAVALLLAGQYLMPPVSAGQRCRWLIESARVELACLPSRTIGRRPTEEAMFRDAVRIAHIAAAAASDPSYRPAEDEALRLFDLAGLLRLCDAALARLTDGARAPNLAEGLARSRRALAGRDARQLRDAAVGLHDAADAGSAESEAAASLFVASRLMDQTA